MVESQLEPRATWETPEKYNSKLLPLNFRPANTPVVKKQM